MKVLFFPLFGCFGLILLFSFLFCMQEQKRKNAKTVAEDIRSSSLIFFPPVFDQINAMSKDDNLGRLFWGDSLVFLSFFVYKEQKKKR